MTTTQLAIATFVVLSQIADIVSTDYALRRGAHEANVLMRKRLVRYIAKPLLAFAYCLVIYAVPSLGLNILFSVIAIATFAVAIHNYLVVGAS